MRCNRGAVTSATFFECKRVAFALRFARRHFITSPTDTMPASRLSFTSERTFPFQERSFHFPRRNTPDDCDAFRQTLDDSTPPPIRTKLLA